MNDISAMMSNYFESLPLRFQEFFFSYLVDKFPTSELDARTIQKICIQFLSDPITLYLLIQWASSLKHRIKDMEEILDLLDIDEISSKHNKFNQYTLTISGKIQSEKLHSALTKIRNYRYLDVSEDIIPLESIIIIDNITFDTDTKFSNHKYHTVLSMIIKNGI